MKLLVVSVRDHKAEAYMAPMFFRSRGEAMRSMMDAVGHKDGQFCKYPDDYVLMAIGTFDDETGMLEASSPTPLITARECVMSDPFVERPGARGTPTA